VPGELPADWRAAIAAVARQTRQAYLSHPWAVQALQGKAAAPAGPAGLRHAEQPLAALSGAPLTARAKLDLLAIVADYVSGHLLHAAGAARLASGDFPHLAAIASDEATDDDAEARFELGLQSLIDG
jgi:hypothetical protein